MPINISDSDQTRGVSDAFWVPVTFEIYRTHVRMIYVFITIFITVSVPDVVIADFAMSIRLLFHD